MKKNCFIVCLLVLASLCSGCQLALAEAPTASVASGTIIEGGDTIRLITDVKRGVIHFTVDGTVPTIESTVYSTPIPITQNTTVQAVVARSKKDVSDVAVFEYKVKAPAPTSNITSPTTFMNINDIKLLCSESEAEIYYTTDGSDPKTSRTTRKYSDTVVLKNSTPGSRTIKLYSTVEGYEPSDVVSYPCSVYQIGQAGGIIFYDKGYHSDGWRYLEAAPEDITVGSTSTFVFGFYRTSPKGSNLYVNGSTYVAGTASATDGNSTGTAVGTGKANTAKLASVMGDTVYTTVYGSDATSTYAIKLFADYVCRGYSDWFLPSKDELSLIYTNLHLNGLGGLASDYYWSSSEGADLGASVYIGVWMWCHDFSRQQYLNQRNQSFRIRAVRAY